MTKQPEPTEPNQPGSTPLDVGMGVLSDFYSATLNYSSGLSKYATDFMLPFLISTTYFQRVESDRISRLSPVDTLTAYLGLLNQNTELLGRGVEGALKMARRFSDVEMHTFMSAFYQWLWQADAGELARVAERQAKLMEQVAVAYPEAINAIKGEYGFHFERGHNPLVAETDRFYLYQVLPYSGKVQVNNQARPILIIPPMYWVPIFWVFCLVSNAAMPTALQTGEFQHTFAFSKILPPRRRCRP
jgi:hypothetical protein